MEVWMKENRLKARIEGVPDTIAEIGEQLAWLGSALRSSTLEIGVSFCTPRIDHIENIEVLETSTLRMSVSYPIDFHIKPGSLDHKTFQGACWRGLFRNPVVAEGYPIRRRASSEDDSLETNVVGVGLEIPLNIMTGLIQSKFITDFDSKIYAKGFSAMVLATKYVESERLLIWHLLYNKNGEHISYIDSRLEEFEVLKSSTLSSAEVEKARHILGWCTQVQNLTGMAIPNL